jgi:hypothetical protein
MSRNPAQILYDGYGNPHSVLIGDILYSSTPGLVVAGSDEDDIVRFLTLSSDGEVPTTKRNVQKKYDLGGPGGLQYTYVGTAERGLGTNEVGWTIKRYELINGDPQGMESTDEKAAIWDNRVSESYA